jgi:hypothetical protein
MKSIKNIGHTPAGMSVLSDDLVEFHAARLMLLIFVCGVKSRRDKSIKIEGLTKLAKLDFFLRYPEFFQRVARHLNKTVASGSESKVESKMIRFHYGPWDERYYQVLPFLEARGLLKINREKSTYNFCLTETGTDVSRTLLANEAFKDLAKNLEEVKAVLAGFNGTKLKNLVYDLFEKEVASKNLNEIIDYE